MLRNYFIAALRNLARNRLHATINVAGLALGFAAATLIYLYVRNELSYDRFLPNHDRTYLLSEHLRISRTESALVTSTIQHEFASQLKLDFPAIEAGDKAVPDRRTLRHGQNEADENVYWADPNVFDLLPLHALAGDLKTALQSPEGAVLTRSMARRYFGRDDPIGEVLEITGTHPDDINRRYPMRVTAVLEDLPANTHLDMQIILPVEAQFRSCGTWTRIRIRPPYPIWCTPTCAWPRALPWRHFSRPCRAFSNVTTRSLRTITTALWSSCGSTVFSTRRPPPKKSGGHAAMSRRSTLCHWLAHWCHWWRASTSKNSDDGGAGQACRGSRSAQGSRCNAQPAHRPIHR